VASEFDPVGLWFARVSPTEENPVEFQVRIARKAKNLTASLVNGASSEPFSGVTWDGRTLTLEMAHYDAKIVAEAKGSDLEGTYARVVSTGTREFPFSASRRAPAPTTVRKAGVSVTGTWAAEIARPAGGSEKVVALLKQKGTAVAGTMATSSGDYGPLHGTFDGEQLVLMVFNGIFVYRFDAELLPDGTLAGEFRSGKNPPVDWKASRQAAAPEFAGPTPKEPGRPFAFRLPDLDGNPVSSSDARFAGKAMIVTAMGTWCPNCHDEAVVLEELERTFGAEGLEVVAFTYEYSGDMERNRRLVGEFRKRVGADYPILFAGTTKEAGGSPLFAALVGPRAYPTTIFLDRKHRIVKVHAGFDGPATGGRYRKLKNDWKETARKLVGASAEFVVPDSTSIGIR
jgi:thiol-disulfide isomerase/thioredoxin